MIRWSPSSHEFAPSSCAAIPFSIGALVSMFLFLAVGTLATLSMMMFSSATRSSLYDIVVPRTLQFHRLSGINFLTAISDLAESGLEVVHLVDERLQDVVELLHVSGSVSFRDVADQCCIC